MRATGAALHPVEGAVDELDVLHAGDLAANSWIRCARWQMVNDRCAYSIRADLGNARSEATCNWARARRAGNLLALSNGRVRSSQSPFCHIEIAIWPECKPTWIIQTGGEDSDLG